MNRERRQQVEDLYHAAQKRRPGERAAILARADPEIRREVEVLLAQDEALTKEPAAKHVPSSASTASRPSQEKRLGPDPAVSPLSESFSASLKRRLPWWMYVVVLSYVVTLAFFFYAMIRAPAQLDRDFTQAFLDEAMVIRSVKADSPSGRGGLRVADRVLMIDDQPIRNVGDWTAATANMRALFPQRWLVARDGSRVTLEIIPDAGSLRSKRDESYVAVVSLTLTGFCLGFLILWKRPSDPVARLGAWFMLSAAFAFGLPWGWAVEWRALPAVVQFLLWIPQLSRFVIEAIFLSFFASFPRPLVKRRWIWVAIWAPVLVTLPWRVAAFYRLIQPDRFAPVPSWILRAGLVRTMVYLVIGIFVLAVSYRRFLDINEKRRVRVLMLGTAMSVISATMMVWFDTFSGRVSTVAKMLPIFPFTLAGPLSMGYAILRHRVLDISVIIRQGLQYALARGLVLGVVPAVGVFLAVDLAMNSQEPLIRVMQDRGWVYAGLSGLALIAYWQRKRWLEAVDKRFFRETYNGQRVLRDIVDEIREAKSFERVSPQVVERIATVLHPEFVSIMVRQTDDHSYRSLTSVPSEQAPPPIPADSKLIGLMRLLRSPVNGMYSESTWLHQRLPRQEVHVVRRARIDLLVPIAINPGRPEALLALGVKRSEEPYTREDQELLEAIAGGLALLLEQSSPSVTSTSRFEECPKCGVCYEPRSGTCTVDGATLSAVSLPRRLAGRYQLERRLGRGGMGTVYRATDEALGRRVAVKVIRDDWVGNAEAAQRFRREARASASFTHQNVVTVHDYGVEAGARAFLVMEFLEGETLREEITRHTRLTPDRTVHILDGVGAAVEAAHSRHLLHRDLKPENIFLAQSGERSEEVVKVLDFGIAKFLAADDDGATATLVTDAGTLVGTPAYMSPEQLIGGKPDVRWDVWALTIVAYESLTGALPFGPASSDEWRRRILSGNFTPLDRHLSHPPARWNAFFAWAFDPNPAKRAHSAGEFLHRLEEAIH